MPLRRVCVLVIILVVSISTDVTADHSILQVFEPFDIAFGSSFEECTKILYEKFGASLSTKPYRQDGIMSCYEVSDPENIHWYGSPVGVDFTFENNGLATCNIIYQIMYEEYGYPLNEEKNTNNLETGYQIFNNLINEFQLIYSKPTDQYVMIMDEDRAYYDYPTTKAEVERILFTEDIDNLVLLVEFDNVVVTIVRYSAMDSAVSVFYNSVEFISMQSEHTSQGGLPF